MVPMSSPGRRLWKDKDHISKLPDTILCHILSSLSTKAVVKTSILSKRWKYLWTKVPALDFTEKSEMFVGTIHYGRLSLERKICFKSFVDKVLFHNDVSYVQCFCLAINNADEFYVSSWLNAAARREIRELNINLYWNSNLHVSLPPRLLSGEKLVVLKLKGHLILNALMSSHLPNLETIHLDKLMIAADDFMRRLLSSCPFLKELHIVRCDGLPSVLCVESLTLKSLTIIQEIDEGLASTYFVIKTPNLRYLNLHGTLPQYDIGDMCSLSEAYLNLDYDYDVDDNDQAWNLLKKVSTVKTLRLSSENFIVEAKLPPFKNLTCLEQDADAILCRLFKCAPKIKSLVLHNFNHEYAFVPELAPMHLPCLESVEVSWFDGDEEDTSVLAYILKAGSALKEMKIKMSNCVVGGEIAVYKELLSFPRSSAVCQVNIV